MWRSYWSPRFPGPCSAAGEAAAVRSSAPRRRAAHCNEGNASRNEDQRSQEWIKEIKVKHTHRQRESRKNSADELICRAEIEVQTCRHGEGREVSWERSRGVCTTACKADRKVLTSSEPSPEPCVDWDGWDGGGRGCAYAYSEFTLFYSRNQHNIVKQLYSKKKKKKEPSESDCSVTEGGRGNLCQWQGLQGPGAPTLQGFGCLQRGAFKMDLRPSSLVSPPWGTTQVWIYTNGFPFIPSE